MMRACSFFSCFALGSLEMCSLILVDRLIHSVCMLSHYASPHRALDTRALRTTLIRRFVRIPELREHEWA